MLLVGPFDVIISICPGFIRVLDYNLRACSLHERRFDEEILGRPSAGPRTSSRHHHG